MQHECADTETVPPTTAKLAHLIVRKAAPACRRCMPPLRHLALTCHLCPQAQGAPPVLDEVLPVYVRFAGALDALLAAGARRSGGWWLQFATGCAGRAACPQRLAACLWCGAAAAASFPPAHLMACRGCRFLCFHTGHRPLQLWGVQLGALETPAQRLAAYDALLATRVTRMAPLQTLDW